MNKWVMACVLASILVTGPLFNQTKKPGSGQNTSIAGKISPPDEAEGVQLVNGKDSVKAALFSGNFFAQVRPGKYKLLISTKNINRVVQLDNIEVKQNQALNIGEIILH